MHLTREQCRKCEEEEKQPEGEDVQIIQSNELGEDFVSLQGRDG